MVILILFLEIFVLVVMDYVNYRKSVKYIIIMNDIYFLLLWGGKRVFF